MGDLDFRGMSHKELNIASFTRKKEALEFAKKNGWPQKYVSTAANRFSKFWVVGQQINHNTIRFLNRDGGYNDFDYMGYW